MPRMDLLKKLSGAIQPPFSDLTAREQNYLKKSGKRCCQYWNTSVNDWADTGTLSRIFFSEDRYRIKPSTREPTAEKPVSGYAAKALTLGYSRLIFDGPATIVLWVDGSKTVVKCSEDDLCNVDALRGFLLCYFLKHKALSRTQMHKQLDWLKPERVTEYLTKFVVKHTGYSVAKVNELLTKLES